MTDTPDTIPARTMAPQRAVGPARGYRLEESYWGYRVVPLGSAPFGLVVLQSIALIAGASLVAAAGTVGLLAGAADLIFRLPVIVLIGALGLALMWFASRGTQIQIEVDTINGEVREVIRNRTGALTVMARYGFDSIGSVFIARSEGLPPTLVLRYRNTARTMTVANGSEVDLARLRDRMGRDLIVSRGAD